MRRWQLAMVTALNALLGILLALAINVASEALPRSLEQHPGRAWLLVAVFGLATVGCAVTLARSRPSADRHPSGSLRLGGVHVGRDLRIEGDGNRVTGGHEVPADIPAAASHTRRRGRRQSP